MTRRTRNRKGPAGGQARTRQDEAGFSLVETMVSLAVGGSLLIGALSVMISAARLDEASRENSTAISAVQQVVERMDDVPFRELYARYNGIASDDVTVAGEAAAITNPGNTFFVASLGIGNMPNTGEIIFPTVAGGDLSETVVNPNLGLPMDLNLDGVVGDGDRSADYEILPAIIRVTWTGRGGNHTMEVFTTFTE